MRSNSALIIIMKNAVRLANYSRTGTFHGLLPTDEACTSWEQPANQAENIFCIEHKSWNREPDREQKKE